jgi:hypothetical protein
MSVLAAEETPIVGCLPIDNTGARDVSDRIEDLDDVKSWIAEHDGRINAWWEAQREWNTQNDASHVRIGSRLDDLRQRIESLERRVVYAAGFATAIGVTIGTLIGKLF